MVLEANALERLIVVGSRPSVMTPFLARTLTWAVANLALDKNIDLVRVVLNCNQTTVVHVVLAEMPRVRL